MPDITQLYITVVDGEAKVSSPVGVDIPTGDILAAMLELARAAGADLDTCLLVPDGGDMTVHQPVDGDTEVRGIGAWADEPNAWGIGCTLADALRAVLGGGRG